MIVLLVAALLAAFLVVVLSPPAHAADDPKLPIPVCPHPGLRSRTPVPGVSDCKEAPTPDSPGNGIAGLLRRRRRDKLPAAGGPVRCRARAPRSTSSTGTPGCAGTPTTSAAARTRCGNPDAVIGTAVSNWIMQAPIALTALTGSFTEVAFHPTFLDAFDPVVERVSTALHDNLFASWIPVVLALLGCVDHLQGTPSARWPPPPLPSAGRSDRGHPGDRPVPLADRRGQCRRRHRHRRPSGRPWDELDGDATGTDPGTAVASQVHESILYRAWLAGTLGSPDSETAKKYGPDALQGPGADLARGRRGRRTTPSEGKKIIEAKKQQWERGRRQDPGRGPGGVRAPHRRALRDPRRLRLPLRARAPSWRCRSCCCPRC